MEKIRWGIIGCGDVTEVKSGPAFNKVPDSALVAVMRRDALKAADYAKRHNVPRWYDNAEALINDPEVNAIYVATPPDSHAAYSIAALQAGKPVYVEKPMSVNHDGAVAICEVAEKLGVKLVVAHYRREWPLFKKLKELIDQKIIGQITQVDLVLNKLPLSPQERSDEKIAWRVNPAKSGGGLFHDLAPHQLDIMYQLFGEAEKISGTAINQAKLYPADDLVTCDIRFSNDLRFSGKWDFNAAVEEDWCEITGTGGKISFSFFNNNSLHLLENNQSKRIDFEYLPHVQQPMIEKTVQYFLGRAQNPCPGRAGAAVMNWIDQVTSS